MDVVELIVDADVAGSTNAYVGGNVRLSAAEADVTARADDIAEADAFLIGIAVFSGTGADVEADVSDTVAAYVAKVTRDHPIPALPTDG